MGGTCNENLVIGEEFHGITRTARDGRPSTAIRVQTPPMTGNGITIRESVITGGAPGHRGRTAEPPSLTETRFSLPREMGSLSSAAVGEHRQQQDPEQRSRGNRDPATSTARIGWSGPEQPRAPQHNSEQWSEGFRYRGLRTDLLQHHPEQFRSWGLRGPKLPGRDRGLYHQRQRRRWHSGDERCWSGHRH